jgi:tRNA 2-thiocytidine biosynthesis protein TtcA
MKIILALMATLTAIYVVSLPAQEITNPADTYVFRNDDRPEYNKNLSVDELKALKNADDITLIDVRLTEDFALDPTLIPGAQYRDPEMIASWADLFPKDKKVVLYCVKGAWVSHKAATYLNEKGYDVSTLDGGINSWKASEE